MTTVTGRHGQKCCQLCNPRPDKPLNVNRQAGALTVPFEKTIEPLHEPVVLRGADGLFNVAARVELLMRWAIAPILR